MKIETGQMRRCPRRFAGTEPSSILELPRATQFQVIGGVRYALSAQRFDADLLVRGALEMDVRGRCARCGEFCAQTIRDKDFMRSYPLGAADELIDLTADIREAILLALPINFLCSKTCRGLCVNCGANLNKAPCVCRKPRRAAPWGALDQLKVTRK